MTGTRASFQRECGRAEFQNLFVEMRRSDYSMESHVFLFNFPLESSGTFFQKKSPDRDTFMFFGGGERRGICFVLSDMLFLFCGEEDNI